jgi:hypothetical protein
MFVRGDVSPARKTITIPYSRETERQKLHATANPWTLSARDLGLDQRLTVMHSVALDLGARHEEAAAKNGSAVFPALPKGKIAEIVSDTGQLRWNVSQPDAGYFLVDATRTKLWTGFGQERTFALGEIQLRLGKTRLDWATVSLCALEGGGFDQPGRILVAATGWVQNQGAQIQFLDGDKITQAGKWGAAPVLCEGVAAEILLPIPPHRVRFFSLDESGNRRAAVPVGHRDGKALLSLGPQHRTLWYEVEIR